MAIEHKDILDASSNSHTPQGFTAASNDTVLSKNSAGVLEWVARTALGGGAVYAMAHMHNNTTAINGGSGIVALDTFYTIGSNGTTSWTFPHLDGGFTANSGGDGLVFPVTGDYFCIFTGNVIGDTASTDKYDAIIDFFKNSTAEGHISTVYLDKFKKQQINVFAVVDAVAGDEVTVRSKIATGGYDTGSAPTAQVWTDTLLFTFLLHSN